MKFSNVIIAYMLVGSMMWAGGVLAWDNVGVSSVFVDQDGNDVEGNEETANELEDSGGPIQNAVQALGGGALLAVWNLISKLIGAFIWPITALSAIGAPIEVVVIGGGSLSAAFFVSFVRLIRGV